MPVAVWNEPAGHFWHGVVEPVTGEKDPCSHRAQEVWPSQGCEVPMGHSLQDADELLPASGLNVPAKHFRQVVAPHMEL
jgi:hypothetical protein